MPGSATLDPDVLIDDLVEVIDELRGDLHPQFGVRPFRVFVVTRSWTGLMLGEGSYSDSSIEITPQPRVLQWDGYKWALLAQGFHEDGVIRLVEVSLSYLYADLAPANLRPNQQFFYVLVDAYGQQSERRTLRSYRPPYPDREKDIGWVVDLMDFNLSSDEMPDLVLT